MASPHLLAGRRPVASLTVAALCAAPAWAQDPPPIDLLSFARGAVPVAVEGDAKALGVGIAEALLAIDGDGSPHALTPKPGGAGTRIAFVYRLPAPTTFTSFGVPNVVETPSPSQTFVREVQVFGSDSGADGGFRLLARTTLSTHATRGQTTEMPAAVQTPVRWVRIELAGGIDVQRDKTFLQFSEIIGRGRQDSVPLSQAFSGRWKGRGVQLELVQDGAIVTGCYDGVGELDGSVSGNLLRATGHTRPGDIPSVFVLAVGAGGAITGVRSTNGAPFRLVAGDAAPGMKSACARTAVRVPGCGAVLHGIEFAFDSARIRPDSGPLLDGLARGLTASPAAAITVVGHTSSEGTDAYNDGLSLRRAEAVVAAVVERGVARARLQASGRGERQPIADNATEAGRSLNRRVGIECP